MKTIRISFSILLLSFMAISCSTTPTEKSIKYDHPDLAYQWNFEMTKDPNTGKPEKQRLLPIIDELKNDASRSTNSINWVSRGPYKVGGRTRAILFDPNDNTDKRVIAGSTSGGIWINNDITSASSEWYQVAGDMANFAISCITYDPSNTQIMYAGTGESFNPTDVQGAGIWKSTDGGMTWNHLNNTATQYYMADIIVDTNGDVYYAGTTSGSSAGIYKSTDGGNSFTQIESTPVDDLELASDGTIWAGTHNGKVLKKTANASTFSNSYNTIPNPHKRVKLATSASDPNVIVAILTSNTQVQKLVKTVNGGTSWFDISITNFAAQQAWYDLQIGINPSNPNIVIVGGLDAYITTNGSTFTKFSNWYASTTASDYVHADQHEIKFRPNHADQAIIATDGGISYITNIGNGTPQASIRNNNYVVTQFYSGDINPTAGSNNMVAGAQDNGTQYFDTAGIDDTEEINGGDGMYCHIDQTQGNFVFVAYINNNIDLKTMDTNASYTVLSSNTGSFVNPSAYDSNLNYFYSYQGSGQINRVKIFADNAVVRNISNADRAVITVSGLGSISNLKVSPYTTTSTKLFVASGTNVYKIINAHALNSPNKINITNNAIGSGIISSIEFGADENKILVTKSSYGVTSVWYTPDGGATWQNKESDLPDMPVRWGLISPLDSNIVLLATEMGVWRTENFSATNPHWQAANLNMGNVRTDMLKLRASDNTVMATTYGRGVFTSDSSILKVTAETLTNTNINVYPNPNTNGHVNISLSENYGNFDASIYDTNGRLIKTKKLYFNNLNQVFNYGKLSRGIYILKLSNKKYNFTKRLIIK